MNKKQRNTIEALAGLVTLAGIGTAAGIAYKKYREVFPPVKPLGEVKHSVRILERPLNVDGKRIYGELLLPTDVTGPIPTVIVCHGFNANYKLAREAVGRALAMSGYAAYCFDFCGGSTKSKSSGSFMDMTVLTEVDDLLAVIDHIKELPMVDPDRIYLLGGSQGGVVSALAAVQRRDVIRAMVLYYPAFVIPDDAHKRFPSKEEIPDEFTFFGITNGGEYHRVAWDLDLYGTIGAYDKPVLILHGDKDVVVPYEYAERAAEVYPNAKLVRFGGEVHGWTADGKRRAAELSYQFFENN